MKAIELKYGENVKLTLNGQTLNIKANTDGTHFVISSLDNDMSIVPDARNNIFISAEKQKLVRQ